MKKLTSIAIFMLLAFGLKMMAGNVSMEQAETVAMNFYFERHNMFQGEIPWEMIRIQSVHTEKDALQTYYYVFHFNPAGFVIVTADDCLVPVLGYSFEHNYVAENQPPNVQWWFKQYKDQVRFARENALQPELKIAELWEHYLDEDFRHLSFKTGSRQTGPLLTTLWNQGWPYNYYCPPGTPAGCQSTAMAQILYYWKWPDHGQGYTEYIPATNPLHGLQVADYENTFYRFHEMVDSPVTPNTAIAEFIYHAAVNFHTDFLPGFSQSDSMFVKNHQAAADSTSLHFKLLPAFIHYRDSMPVENWKNLMLEMLDASAPIFYSGYDNYPLTGHHWVCDGYQNEDYFHFNLGWGGSSNGYYTIDNLPSGLNYNHFMTSYLIPDTISFTYPLYCSGADTLVALEGSIEDGSGPIHNYPNNTSASWLIDPQTAYDSVTNIVITVKRLDLFEDGERIYIYDGEDNTAPLLAELSGSTIPGNITSTGNKMFVEFNTDAENTAAGFYLNYKTNRPVWCSGLTNLTAQSATFDDGSGSFYYNNNTTCLWTVNPGTGEPLTIHFNYFETEEEKDMLMIYDHATQQLLASLSGHYETPPEPVTSPSGRFFLTFSSNGAIQGKGWEIWYDVTAGNDKEFIVQGSKFKVDVYPNPVLGIATIQYDLPETAKVQMDIINYLGQRVGNLCEGMKPAGTHQATTDLSNLPSGLYFLRTSTTNHRQSTIHSSVVKVIKR
jgi:hypothetical protein